MLLIKMNDILPSSKSWMMNLLRCLVRLLKQCPQGVGSIWLHQVNLKQLLMAIVIVNKKMMVYWLYRGNVDCFMDIQVEWGNGFWK